MDAIDAKHCETYQIFSNSSCSRQAEISFERNFEPADWARFKIVLYPNALKGMAPWLLKNAWLRSDMWYFLPVHGAGGICEQILVTKNSCSALFDGVARHAGRQGRRKPWTTSPSAFKLMISFGGSYPAVNLRWNSSSDVHLPKSRISQTTHAFTFFSADKIDMASCLEDRNTSDHLLGWSVLVVCTWGCYKCRQLML